MKFKEYILESSNKSKIPFDILKNTFILVIGGSGSGKNYYFEKHFKNIELVDNDQITKELSGGDFEKARKMISKATNIANKQLEQAFKSGKSIGQVSTGSNLKGVENKLIKAKSFGFYTVLILIDTDVKTSIKRNSQRAEKGNQGLVPDWKVQKTNENARKTFDSLKSSEVVDYSEIVKN